jgi:hypothetical protein
MSSTTFAENVQQELQQSRLAKTIVLNQMRLVQAFATVNPDIQISIEVPTKPAPSQWNLVGLPELDKERAKEQSKTPTFHFDGFQVTSSAKRSFRQKWVAGPRYADKASEEDQTFVHNLVYSTGSDSAGAQSTDPTTDVAATSDTE